MAKISVKAATTSLTVNLFIQDSSSTTGAGLTGLAYNTASLVAYYALPAAAAVSITLATQTTTGAFSSGGFVEISSTNMPGWYRFDVPNAAIASGRFSSIHFKGATNMAPLPLEIELTGWDNSDAVRGGMTALPNANAEAAGGLYTRGTGAGQINQDANGRVDTNLKAAAGTAVTLDANNVLNVSTKYTGGTLQTARDLGASVLLAAGQKVDVDTIKTNPVVNAGTITFPTGATLASTTNITAGTITTTTNVTNAPPDSSGVTTLLSRVTAAVALASSLPANFTALLITAAGKISEVVTLSGNTPQTGDFFATAIAEAAAVPATNASAAAKLAWLAAMGLNPLKQTATTLKLRNNADGADIGTSTTSDDGTTATRGKFA